jgi:hypothetical protein
MKASDLYEDTLEHYMDTADEDLDGRDDADPDPMIDEWGYPTMSPEFDEDQMLEATYEPDDPEDSEAKLPLLEAYDLMEFTAPASQEEADILDETPFLTDERGMPKDRLRFVDDADHTDWLLKRSLERHRAMDHNLDDQMYGGDMSRMTDEERMERADSDNLGFSIKRGLKKFGKGVRKGVGVTAKYTGAKFVYDRALTPIAKALTYPQRRLIKREVNRLVARRARKISWDRRRSKTPTPNEITEAKVWSSRYLKTKGGRFGKLLAALGIGELLAAKKKVRVRGETFVPSSSGDFVGMEPVTAALLGMSIPALAMILSAILKRASKAGAPSDPTAAAPEGTVEQTPSEPSEEPGNEAAEPEPVTPSDEDETSGNRTADFILGRWMSGAMLVSVQRQKWEKKIERLKELLQRARAGDPKASSTIEKTMKAAKGGDKKAAENVENLKKADEVLKAEERQERASSDGSTSWGESSEIRRNQV